MLRLTACKLPSRYWLSSPNAAINLPTPGLGQQRMAYEWTEDEINMVEGGCRV